MSRLLTVEAQTLALSAVAAGETFHLGSACLPSYFTVKNWVLDGNPAQVQQRITAYRSGYRPAVVVGLGLSAALSVLARSPLPTIFAAAASVAMLQMYEGALPAELRLPLEAWPRLLLTGEASLPERIALPASRQPAGMGL